MLVFCFIIPFREKKGDKIKMKKIYAVNICVLFIMFLTAGMIAAPNDDTKTVESLLTDRISTLSGFYDAEIDKDETRSRLEYIEADKLLHNDLTLMKAYENTDMDRIIDAEVKIISCKRMAYGIIKGNAEITYTMEGYDGRRTESHAYFYTGEIIDEKTKLTQLKNI